MRKTFVALIAVIVIVMIGAAAGLYLLEPRQPQVYTLFPPRTNETYELSTAQGGFSFLSTSLEHFVTISNQSYYAMAEVKGDGLSLMMSPFMWNLAGANGSVNMIFRDDRLQVSMDLSNVTDISDIKVTGYPGLMYGKELWFPFGTATEQLKVLALPSIVSDLPNFYSVLNYSTYVYAGSIGDFSYDMWLTSNPNITSLGSKDIEVMIWMYSQSPGLSQPFVNVGTVSAPTIINGTTVTAQYQVYVLPHTGSATGWAGVYFVLEYPSAGGVARGEVGVPVKDLLEDISSLLPKVGLSFYNPSTYYLNAIQVGMETYYSATNSLVAGYTLYSWKVVIGRVAR
ncbi:MAG: GH12 family glycosyl hydrolase domain-containing protein [Thermoprotei archaeon]|nr:cellulase [TACK group archaeon]